MVGEFIQVWTPAVVVAVGRLTSAALAQVRSPGVGLDDLLEFGSSAVELATGVSRARRGVVGSSWLMVFLLLSAQGAVAELPADSAASFIEDLAESAAAVGFTLLSVFLALAIYDTIAPSLRVGLPRPRPPPPLGPVDLREPWWKTRTLGRGAFVRGPAAFP